MRLTEPFTPIPNSILDALICSALSQCQWHAIAWIIRNTLGWNSDSVPFTWYQIAKEVGMDKSTVLRAARQLCQKQLLIIKDGLICIQLDAEVWRKAVRRRTGAATHLRRCTRAPLLRRAKESSKERYKNYKANHHPAGAARPIAGKYAATTNR